MSRAHSPMRSLEEFADELYFPHICRSEEVKLKSIAMPFESFRRRALEHNPSYSFCERCYRGTQKLTTVLCPRHGEFFARAGGLIAQSMLCRLCEARPPSNLSLESLHEVVRVATTGRFQLKSFSGALMVLTCSTHGEFSKSLSMALARKQWCGACRIHSVLSEAEFQETVAARHGDRYTLVGPYRGLAQSIAAVCREHGPFSAKAKRLIHGTGCRPCGKLAHSASIRRATPLEFYEEAVATHGNRYTYDLLSFRMKSEPVWIRCGEHGWFSQTGTKHTTMGQGCAPCAKKMSSGEREVATVLKELGVAFVREKVFSGLRTARGGIPRFDFYLPDHGVLIEFDGIGHFEKTHFYGMDETEAEERFAAQQDNDLLKEKWAAAMGYRLLRFRAKRVVREELGALLG